METQQNAKVAKQPKPIEPYSTLAFDAYITFKALGGLLVDDDGVITKMTQEDFCEKYGVNVSTVWRWRQNMPNLGELIRERREAIAPLARESAAWNQLFLLGMQKQDKRAAVDALKTYLGHFAGLRLPSQAVKHDATDALAEALGRVHQRRQQDAEPIEGEIIPREPSY